MSTRGKKFKCIKSETFSFTVGEWYECIYDDPELSHAFIDNNGNLNGFGGCNDEHFDLRNPKDKKRMFS